MFFVFGSPRSGTTLLAQCLNAHSDLAVPHETDFIIPAAFIFDRVPDVGVRAGLLKQLLPRTSAFAHSIGEHLDARTIENIVDENASDLARLLDAIYGAVAAGEGARMAGDKSPNDLLFLRMLVKVGGIAPDTRLIHIVRDVRDVVASIRQARMTSDPESWFPRMWGASNLYLFDLYSASERYLLVRYEDFVTSPETTLRRVCQHLDVPFQDAMMASERRHARYRSMPHHAKLFQPISGGFIGAYKESLGDDIVARCEEHAAEAIRVFGY